MGGQLQSAENRLAVPHVLQFRLLRRGHLEDDVVVVDGTCIRGNPGPRLAVRRIRELGMHPGSGLHHDLMAIGHKQPHRVGVEGHTPFLKDDFLGNSDAQGVLSRRYGEEFLLG